MKGIVNTNTSVVAGRRHLKHMRYDKATGKFCATEKRIKNRVTVSYELDEMNHEILSMYLVSENTKMGKLFLSPRIYS